VVLAGSDSFLEPPGKWDVHLEMLMKNGIHNIEYMDFESLLADPIYEFLFIVITLELKGATGSPVRPIAIR
jgi:kynurenine formamidase